MVPAAASTRRQRSVRQLFAWYALASLLPTIALGFAINGMIQAQATESGLREARSEARLLSRAGFGPLFGAEPLDGPLTPEQARYVARVRDAAVTSGAVTRLRVRDIHGRVVFGQDATADGPSEATARAAAGESVAFLARLDTERGDRQGSRVAEVYEPLRAPGSEQTIGVLELYLPYEEIAEDVARRAADAVAVLVGGLSVLWLCLLAISGSVTRRLAQEAARNERLALSDALTGLPNRERFVDLVAEAVAGATAIAPAAVAVIDLDRFRQVNATLGHTNGDLLLTALARRLSAELPGNATLARLGGDEFGLILRDLDGPGGADGVLLEVRRMLGRPVDLDGLPLSVEASVGYALAPFDGPDAPRLLQRADTAMHVAKHAHSPVIRYRPDQELYDQKTLELVSGLAEAIRGGELVLHYQPKVDVRTGTVIAVEALVRWDHPVHGLLYPDAFLPAAEQTDLIEPLTAWVLREAVAALGRMDPAGALSMAVNVSARSLVRAGFAAEVAAVLAETRTPAARVILEITETALVADPARARATLQALHGQGLRISIDDFGAGQTSLAYLADLPVTELKIDKAFVQAMHGDRRNGAIVRSIVNLGHSLGFTVIAEGVETPEALMMLSQWGCDTAQGYWFSRPVTEAVVTELLAQAAFRHGGAEAS